MYHRAASRVVEGRVIAGLLLVAFVLLGALVWINMASPFRDVRSTQTVSECGPGQDPATALCYAPSEPS